MAVPQSLVKTEFDVPLPLVASGKVREIYKINDSTLLFVTTDRISAFDVVLNNGVPSKGAVLNLLSAHWFNLLSTLIPALRTHLVSLQLPSIVSENLPKEAIQQLEHRSMQVRRVKMLPIESIVRGYITGGAWVEYSRNGTVHGIPVQGERGGKLKECDRFTQPLWTPSTKAPPGEKDENIHPDEAAELIGSHYAKTVQELSLEIYTKAHEYALERGIIIADTKFEFGVDEETNDVVLVDEVLTPDSSRFWPANEYQPGRSQASFDKQYLRDWLTQNGLKGKAGVNMPEDVKNETASKYREAFERLAGMKWDQALASTSK